MCPANMNGLRFGSFPFQVYSRLKSVDLKEMGTYDFLAFLIGDFCELLES